MRLQSHPEPPRVTLSDSESLKSYQESRRAVQGRPDSLRGTPEQSGNGPTDRQTDRLTNRQTDGHNRLQRCKDASKNRSLVCSLDRRERFLVACKRLYKSLCRSIGRLVGPLVRPSVTPVLCERFSHHRFCPIARD